jgi:MFS family permease
VVVLALAMALVAFTLEDDRLARKAAAPRAGPLVEWRVIVVAVTLFMYSFGYGGVMSFAALYADANGVTPRGLYFTCFALTIVASRPFSLRMADRVGHARLFVPCLVLVVAAYALLAVGGTLPLLASSAVVFGAGFGSAYPMFAAMVTHEIAPERRGAAFGGIIAAFDTGMGTGSIATGWIVEHFGFRPAWALAASLALFSIPYFLVVAPRLLPSSVRRW